MAEPAARPWTVEEFLAWEADQAERYEYVGGNITMMVGGSRGHNRIAGSLSTLLSIALAGSPCDVLSHAMKVKTEAAVLYPDVVVTCTPGGDRDAWIEDALLVAEVLSPSTSRRDRDEKWRAYQSLPSLRHYLLIAQDEVLVEMFSREGESWQPLRATSLEAVLPLTAFDLSLRLADIYRRTALAG